MPTDTRLCPRVNLQVPDVSEGTAVAGLLADRTRAGILALLRGGSYGVCELAATFGERENNVSNHLARLREVGLVRSGRHEGDARWAFYERDEAAIDASRAALLAILGPPGTTDGPRRATAGRIRRTSALGRHRS